MINAHIVFHYSGPVRLGSVRFVMQHDRNAQLRIVSALSYFWSIFGVVDITLWKVSGKKRTAGGRLTMCLSGYSGRETQKLVFVRFMDKMRAHPIHPFSTTVFTTMLHRSFHIAKQQQMKIY